MKRLPLLALLLAFATALSAQTTAKEEAAIRALLQAQEDAWNAGNLEQFVALSYEPGDSTLFLGSNGPRWGYQTIVDTYRAGYGTGAAMGKLTFELLQVRVTDKRTAYVVGTYHLVRGETTDTGYYLLVLVKTPAGWRIAADHSSASDG